MAETLSFDRTRDALDAYVNADDGRSKAWQQAETHPQILACQKADHDALMQLRRVFHQDTRDTCSASECSTATFESILLAAYNTTTVTGAAHAVARRRAGKDDSRQWLSDHKLSWFVTITAVAAYFFYKMIRLNG